MKLRRLIFGLFWLFPCCGISQIVSLKYDWYQSKFNSLLQVPSEVRWQLRFSDMGTTKREPSWRFMNDVPAPYGIATHDSYTNSGYHRGHMCPAADRSASKAGMKGTFRISNICPQLPDVNTGSWKKTENFERALVRYTDSCRIIAIPLFLEKDTTYIGGGVVAVPHAFLKIIYNVNPDTIYKTFFIWNK